MTQFKLTLVLAIFLNLVFTAASFAQHYEETDLVSDIPGKAAVTDPNLVNPWGLTRSSTSPWWVSDNGPGLSTLYNGQGQIQSLVVTIPGPTAGTTGTPTGAVFNGTTDFQLTPGNPLGNPAIFIFVTEDGTIAGWNPNVPNHSTTAVIMVNQSPQSVFKGATIAQMNQLNTLYVADFRKGKIAV
ncbi:MAG: TIGR03118 family protein, partial [Ignavibacteriales bacterium]